MSCDLCIAGWREAELVGRGLLSVGGAWGQGLLLRCRPNLSPRARRPNLTVRENCSFHEVFGVSYICTTIQIFIHTQYNVYIRNSFNL